MLPLIRGNCLLARNNFLNFRLETKKKKTKKKITDTFAMVIFGYCLPSPIEPTVHVFLY